ncbi:MAG: glycosyltransferase family 2 protein [Ignavibacteriales bacterium]|nr:glycosyltransferase family 2 protein [Ignavibacteriales bacterium]
MPKLTLSMIVKNEEKYLRECLESVKDTVDEIVIVDTGSEDKTVEIAKSYNARIFHFKWINDFSAARNFALSNSTGNWILYLDADERLSSKSVKKLKNLVEINELIGVKCVVVSLDEKLGISQSMKYTRLFRNNSDILFDGKVHEQIENSLIKNNYKIIDSEIIIYHQGYNVPKEELKFKAERNLKLLLNEYKNNKSSYNAYQLANTYSALDDSTNALKYFKEAIVDKNLKRELRAISYMNLADYEMRNQNISSSKEYIDKAIKLNPNLSLINIIAAQIYAKLNLSSAINHCINALKQSKLNLSSDQEIFVDAEKIIYEGILISLQFGDMHSLNCFIENLKKNNKDEGNFIEILFINKYNKNEILIHSTAVNAVNINNFLRIFNFIRNADLKLELFSNLYDRFSTNSKFLNDFGAFLISINQTTEAKIILESSLLNADFEDSALFYLASIYLSTFETQKLEDLLIIIEEKINNDSTSLFSKNKFKILVNKIAPVLK